MHAHLWRVRDWEGQAPPMVRAAPAEVTMEVDKEYMEWILPGREVHGLHFPFPTPFPNLTSVTLLVTQVLQQLPAEQEPLA